MAFAAGHGLVIRQLLPDGRVHRVPTLTHPRKKNGAYQFDGIYGWVKDWARHVTPERWRPDAAAVEYDRALHAKIIAERAAEDAERRANAVTNAWAALKGATVQHHHYLERKGFPNESIFVSPDSRIVLPMWDIANYGKALNSVQFIDEDGSKKFLPGGKAQGSVYRIGTGQKQLLCEGYATALSVRAALHMLHLQAVVYVCFSAGNLAHVAQQIKGARYVVADNDASQTGERVARETQLPWAMPPTVGHDANDMHQADGIAPVAALVRALVRQ